MDALVFVQATVLMSLLQPPPETYDLFDDIMLLSDGAPSYCIIVSCASHLYDVLALSSMLFLSKRSLTYGMLRSCCRGAGVPRASGGGCSLLRGAGLYAAAEEGRG
jgi:hypothetical protein